MVEFILSLYRYFSVRRVALWGGFAVLTGLLAYASWGVRFKEDISGFLPEGGAGERISRAYRYAGIADKLTASVCMTDTAAAPDMELIMAAVDRFAEQLTEADTTGCIAKMTYRTDQRRMQRLSQFLTENMAYFLTEADYRNLDSLMTADHIRRRLDEAKRLLGSPAGMILGQTIAADPLNMAAPLQAGLRGFQADDRYRTFDDYLFTADRRKGVIIITSAFPSSETDNNERLTDMIDRVARDTQDAFHGRVTVKCFGAAGMAVANARRIKQDSMISMALALTLIFSLLIYTFRNMRSILLILVSVLFGWIFAFGMLALLKTEVSLIAVGIGSIIVGIAINYPLHFLDHCRREPNVETVIRRIATPLVIGNITTMGAFLSLVFINSEAMRDLGLFAVFLLAGAILFVLVFLPHAGLPMQNGRTETPTFAAPAAWKPERSKWTVRTVALLSVVFCILSLDTQFETNMQNINYMTSDQREAFREMIESEGTEEETVYHVSEGITPEEALRAYETAKPQIDGLLASGAISRIGGVGNYLPSKAMQEQRLRRWKRFWDEHREVLPMLEQCGAELGFRQGAFSRFAEIVQRDCAARELDFFAPLTETLAENYIAGEPGRFMVISILRVPKQEAEALENRLAGEEHSFAFDAGSISRTMVNSLAGDFNTVLYICGFIVFGFLLLTLGRTELTVLAFLPLIAGWFWILGVMQIAGIRFNIVNIILATLIFGQGDDYAIFITEGLMYEYACGRKLLASYKNGIFLSALITFAGVGSLIIAKHPALHSLAVVSIIGMASVVLMTFVIPPAIFHLLTMQKGKKRRIPVTLPDCLSAIYAFAVFLLGSAGITLAGFFLLGAGRKTDGRQLRYHRLLCRAAHFTVMNIPRVKTRYENPTGETFDKPAVIICNHQSHIDLMCIMMLHPKIIILTNQWVWKSPFYGRLIEYAGFYPVSDGIHSVIDPLKDAFRKGYSIMIFPEGTRSEDCSVQRFHKGAFYLAEQLRADILPVMIHGVGHVLPKKEAALRRGEIHIRIMPRITPQNRSFGTTFGQRAKEIRRYYLEQYAQTAARVETTAYYSHAVHCNYIYKGPQIARSVRAEMKKHRNFAEAVEALSAYRRILVLNCGYGAFPLMLSLVRKDAQVTATDPDEDRLAVAANCPSVPHNLRYVASVPAEETYDIIIEHRQSN
ncbi:MAG: 1-acyl-sn-glycerol-3-phosphate acyltransferase [Bacteroidales bacterium]|jgi:1-acyl-sn-glycerol-3-phosphate acyltransferase|nr:1-acyl-sn-glycerol-3-phosphate acyltransferase [Bacteroidales bacterium]